MTTRTESCASSKILERPIRSFVRVTSCHNLAYARIYSLLPPSLFLRIRDMADLDRIIDEAASLAASRPNRERR